MALLFNIILKFLHQYSEMKKQAEPDYNKQVKVLAKNYRFLDPHYIRLLFQFCQFEAVTACKVLQMIKDTLIPAAFIKKLIDSPNQSQALIKDVEGQFNKKYGEVRQELMEALTEQNQNKNTKYNHVKFSDFQFFNDLPNDVCAEIIAFLDPYSFSRFSQTSTRFYSICQSQALEFYFKNLCLRLFKDTQPILPLMCRFTEIQDYILARPQQYGPNLRNAVTNNLRYNVWKSEPQSFKINLHYYKSFGSYRNLFLQAPRIHFNGVYVCRHKYVKVGERGFTNLITPVHVIYYYRYIRFFEDGSLLCFVTSTKARKQQLAKLLSRHNLNNFNPNDGQDIKIGQYMQYKNTLYLRLVRCNTIFSYQLQINSNQNKISDELMVINYTLELVDEREIVQNLYSYKPYKERILFNYLRNQYVEEDYGERPNAVSL